MLLPAPSPAVFFDKTSACHQSCRLHSPLSFLQPLLLLLVGCSRFTGAERRQFIVRLLKGSINGTGVLQSVSHSTAQFFTKVRAADGIRSHGQLAACGGTRHRSHGQLAVCEGTRHIHGRLHLLQNSLARHSSPPTRGVLAAMTAPYWLPMPPC